MSNDRLGNWRIARGLLAASIVSWALLTFLSVGVPIIVVHVVEAFDDHGSFAPSLFQIFTLLVLYAAYGIPIALLACFILGFPIWKYAEARGLRTPRDATKVGAVVGLLIGLINIVIGFIVGLQTALDDNSSYNSYSWGHQIIDDGLPTLLGWVLEVGKLLVTVMFGCIAGRAAAWAAGIRTAS